MKRFIYIIALFIHTQTLIAKDKVINNPAYEVKTSGIYNISRIEIGKKETRVHLLCTFIPKWWVKFGKTDFIQDAATGEKLFPTAIIGGEFGKEMYMGPSGDSTFVLVFPKLPKTTTKLNFGEDEKVVIFGISLDSKVKKQQTPGVVPSQVQRWIDAELAKAKRKTLVDYTSSQFFTRDTARLIGYIKGYDPRLGFSSGIIYASNELTREDFPTVVNIHPDGRFESAIPMNYPKFTRVLFKNTALKFYIEPGQTLSMTISWDEFLTADRLRNQRYPFKDIEFKGVAGRINQELLSVKTREVDYNNLKQIILKQSPTEFMANQLDFWRESEKLLDGELQGKNFTEQTQAILRNELLLSNANYLFDFIDNREYAASKDSTNNQVLKIPVPLSYYGFLKQVPFNNQSLFISSEFSTFCNRWEYAKPFIKAKWAPRKSFEDYLFDELRLVKSVEDAEYLNFINDLYKKRSSTLSKEERDRLAKQLIQKATPFQKKYASYRKGYDKKYPEDPNLNKPGNKTLKEWSIADTVLTNQFKLQQNLVYEVTKVRALKYLFTKQLPKGKEEARTFLTALEKGITNNFLMEEAEILFYKSYPSVAKPAYDLPPGKGTDVFKKITDQFKGKMLFVDFWGIFCGPCIASIAHNKPIREKYKGSEDIEFIFITSNDESPEPRYSNFVKENNLVHTFRLSDDDYLQLRQLFKFNGIPRYIVINREGQVQNDDFPMHNFEYEIKKVITKN